MDYSRELHFPKLGHGLECSDDQQTTIKTTDKRIMDISPWDGFFNLVWASQFFYQSGQLSKEKEAEKKKEAENQEMPPLTLPASSSRTAKKKGSVRVLEFDEIKKHFELPITEAAKKMNVGVTLLKKRCRELKIMRWPHRKLQSLNSLIDSVKELGKDDEVAKLEMHKWMLERAPGMELSEKTMKLRKACLKARNKRKRRCLALHA